jgi:hypothetical protein
MSSDASFDFGQTRTGRVVDKWRGGSNLIEWQLRQHQRAAAPSSQPGGLAAGAPEARQPRSQPSRVSQRPLSEAVLNEPLSLVLGLGWAD